MIDWIQQNVSPVSICSELCATGEDYNVYEDYNGEDLNVAKDLHHHPFDIPHPEPTDLHVAKDLHHHPFDVPHPEPTDLHVAKDLHHHPFDVPHPKEPVPIISANETETIDH